MESITIQDEFIRLGQLMKLAGMASSGIEAKLVIQDSLVKVNGEITIQRGKKIYPGDVVEYEGQMVTIRSQEC